MNIPIRIRKLKTPTTQIIFGRFPYFLIDRDYIFYQTRFSLIRAFLPVSLRK